MFDNFHYQKSDQNHHFVQKFYNHASLFYERLYHLVHDVVDFYTHLHNYLYKNQIFIFHHSIFSTNQDQVQIVHTDVHEH
jgi:hypothetical protein